MNILYITISDLSNLNKRGIYPDLIRKFIEKGHYVTIITPVERKFKKNTNLKKENGYQILQLKTGNLFKTNLIEKGISNLLLEWQYKKAIQEYFSNIKFDLVLYASPPVTFAKVIDFVKKRDHAQSYLMLKDIFPQNAIDIGLLKKTGLKGFLYRMFKRKEKAFYNVSDFIGCMSPANVRYLLQHNPEINPERVEVCPNSIEPVAQKISPKEDVCRKYGIPSERVLFIYGGNFGKPQGIDFVVEALKQNINKEDRHFILCGKGTDFHKVKVLEGTANITLINGLPKAEYDELVCGCDVGLIFLDHRFTIPNFPSRFLSYIENGMPVLAVTDPNSDVGQIAVAGGFGWWIESNDVDAFTKTVDRICSLKEQIKLMGAKARAYLEENHTVDAEYRIITKHFNEFS